MADPEILKWGVDSEMVRAVFKGGAGERRKIEWTSTALYPS